MVVGSIPSAPAIACLFFYKVCLMKSISKIGRIFSFFGDVRGEIKKISWSGKKEVVITTVVVFLLAIFSAIFFKVVDIASYKIIHMIIGR